MNLLESQPVDVLLTDLRLTGGTEGLDLLERAQALPHPPVCVLMTAYGSEKVAVQAMKRGAYDYITKPLDLEKLEAVLTARCIRARSRRRTGSCARNSTRNSAWKNSSATRPPWSRSTTASGRSRPPAPPC